MTYDQEIWEMKLIQLDDSHVGEQWTNKNNIESMAWKGKFSTGA